MAVIAIDSNKQDAPLSFKCIVSVMNGKWRPMFNITRFIFNILLEPREKSNLPPFKMYLKS